MNHSVLYHPDYTVGSGITPDLLTLSKQSAESGLKLRQALAGWTPKCHHRRWGISPRPENVPMKNGTTCAVQFIEKREFITIGKLLPVTAESSTPSNVT